MAHFPLREADIQALAHSVIAGLIANPAVYPASPIPVATLQAQLDAFVADSGHVVAARAASAQATTAKDGSLAKLTRSMRIVLRYAEGQVARDDARLGLLGWGARAAGKPLQAPGQVRALDAPRQGDGWLFLDWKAPAEGGAVASYRIERRERPSGAWAIAAMATESEATLENQERHKDWEYRVIAVNKAGEGVPSNTVAAVV